MSINSRRDLISPRAQRKIVVEPSNKITSYFSSNQPPIQKTEVLVNPPPAKKAKLTVEDTTNVILIDTESSDIDSTSGCSPVKQVKKTVAKRLPSTRPLFECPEPFVKKDLTTPIKAARSALVSLNLDKPKRPALLCSGIDTVGSKSFTNQSGSECAGPSVLISRQSKWFNNSPDSKNRASYSSPQTSSCIAPSPVKKLRSPLHASSGITSRGRLPAATFSPIKIGPRKPVVVLQKLDLFPKGPKPTSISKDCEEPLKNPQTAPSALTEKTEAASSKVARRVVRQSNLSIQAEQDRLSVSSRFEVGLEEIISAARVAFQSTNRDLETRLELRQSTQLSSNVTQTGNEQRSQLASRYHINFNFFLARDNQEVAAIGALRRLGRRFYPCAEDIHAILFKIARNTEDRLALYRAQEFLYNMLSLHPPCGKTMRDYYWSVLSSRYDDRDEYSRWENLNTMLKDMLNVPTTDLESSSDVSAAPTEIERRRAVLAFVVRLLDEDLHCWVRLLNCQEAQPSPSARLRQKLDIPLVARLFWPQSDAGRFNFVCRELVSLHSSAVESQNNAVLCYTKSLVNMMITVCQLSELHLPLKIRRPGQSMFEIARMINLNSKESIISSESFLYSFRSTELRLLLSLEILNRQSNPPRLLGVEQLSLKALLSFVLGTESQLNAVDFSTRLRGRAAEFQCCFVTAVSAYLKLYGTSKTWFILRDRYKKSSRQMERYSPEPVDMFSSSYTKQHLIDDLKQAKWLLDADTKGKRVLFDLFRC